MTGEQEEIAKMVAKVSPILEGHTAPVQGAVLADLLAMWLAGHVIPGDGKETRKVWDRLLQMHLVMVRKLAVENAKILGTYEE